MKNHLARKVQLLIFATFLFSNYPLKSQLYINEFVASNSSEGYYDDIFDDYPDWIEIYNAGKNAIDLSGYYLTDDLTDLNKWKIPSDHIIESKGFLLFIADGNDTLNHTCFKLSADGESIGISNKKKQLLDSVIFMPQTSDISLGRSVNDIAEWLYYTTPTPGSTNTTDGYTSRCMSPEFSVSAGFYDAPIQVELGSPNSSAVIHYTTDGSEPDNTSIIYSEPISIDSNTVIKAICFENEKIQSEIVTNSYFIGEDVSLPVISFSMDSLYTSSFPPKTEIEVHFEYFDEEHEQQVSQYTGARRTGYVDIYPLRTNSLYARSEYGESRINYPLFKNRQLTAYKNIVLRNGGYTDYQYTYFRDGLIHSFAVNRLDIEYQSYQPVLVFANGGYHGLMNMRDKQNEFYLENTWGVDKDNIDFLEYQTESPIDILAGDTVHYHNMISFLESADMTLDENFETLKTMIDINNFMDYYMLEMYSANSDWPDKNCKIWRPREDDGKWRWIMFDTEYGYGLYWSVTVNMFEYLYNTNNEIFHNRYWVTIIFQKFMENESARNLFLQRYCALLNTVFSNQNALHLVDSLKNRIEPEMERHLDKWGTRDYGIGTINQWESNCKVLYNFARKRPACVRENIMDFYGLSDTVSVTLTSNGGTVYLNDFEYCSDSVTGYFFKDIPFQLKAVPDNGYQFVKWENISGTANDLVTFTPDSAITIRALFEPVYSNILPSVFTSDTILSDSVNPYVATGHLIIPANINLTLENGVALLMPEDCNIYVYGSLTVNGTENSPVIIDGYSSIWGAVCFKNSTGLSELNHLTLENATTGDDLLFYTGAVSAYNAEIKMDGAVIKGVTVNSVFAQYSTISIMNSYFQSNGTCDLVNIKHCDSPVVENCCFMDSKMEDTDAIDFDDVTNGVIRNNKIYNLSGGTNSDGIDIGEESTDVLIYGNLITNCSDKGISVGQESEVTVRHNVIFNCAKGVGVKDYNAFAEITNNTIYNTTIGVACYEKNLGSGTGNASVENTIIADASLSPVVEKNGGEITVNYSLSNTIPLSGTNNLNEEPCLTDPYMLNFKLSDDSPCINSGNPDYPLDNDSTIADIGAYYSSISTNKVAELLINEFYSNSDDDDPQDWIEIYNKGEADLDMSGWYVLDNSTSFLKMPEATILKSKEYAVICKDTADHVSFFGADDNLIGNFDFNLGNSSDMIRFLDDNYIPSNLIAYDEDDGWPDSDDKVKISVALIDTSLSLTESINWRTGYKRYGTPGYSNTPPRISNIYINEIVGTSQDVYPDNAGEYEDWIEIYNANDEAVDIGSLFITDDMTNPALSQIRQNEPDSTTIPANGFIVLFADRDTEQGVLHLDFKISSSDEQLAIVQLVGLDTVIIDQVSYEELEADSSYGRTTDGGDTWKNLTYTPCETNSFSSSGKIEIASAVYPNPTTGYVYIGLTNAFGKDVRIQIVNMLGQVILQQNFYNLSYTPVLQMDLSAIQGGMYFIRIDTNENILVKPIIVNTKD